MVQTDPTMELIVEPNFTIGLIFSTGELDPIHTEIGKTPARLFRILGVNLGQSDKGTPIVRPGLQLWQTFNSSFPGHNWSTRDPPGKKMY